MMLGRMKKRLLTIALATGLLSGMGSARAGELLVKVEGLNPEGRLVLAVVQNESEWGEGGRPLVAINAQVTGETMQFRLPIPDGKVAVRLFHDANGNGELDMNLLGIPKEGYGFSRNPEARGPPSFKDAAFEVRGETLATIRVR